MEGSRLKIVSGIRFIEANMSVMAAVVIHLPLIFCWSWDKIRVRNFPLPPNPKSYENEFIYFPLRENERCWCDQEKKCGSRVKMAASVYSMQIAVDHEAIGMLWRVSNTWCYYEYHLDLLPSQAERKIAGSWEKHFYFIWFVNDILALHECESVPRNSVVFNLVNTM